MNLTASKKELTSALKRACSVAERKSTMPLLSCVKLTASDGVLDVRATCLDVWVRERCAAELTSAGSVAVSAKEFLSRVEAMPEGPVVLKVKDDKLAVSAPGSSRRFSLATVPADDYPTIPEPQGEAISLDSETLLALMGRAIHAISGDQTRPHLASMLLERDGKHLRAVATDGHRLAKIDAPLNGEKAPSMLIPGRGVRDVLKLASAEETIDLACEPPNAFFSIRGVTLGVRLIDATFPPFEQVIPKTSPSVSTAARASLVESIRAVSLASNEKTGGVRLRFQSGFIRVEATSQAGDGFDEVPAEYDGKPMSIVCRADYLLDALEAHGGESVGIAFGGEVDPIVMRTDGAVFVTMPMRDLQ